MHAQDTTSVHAQDTTSVHAQDTTSVHAQDTTSVHAQDTTSVHAQDTTSVHAQDTTSVHAQDTTSVHAQDTTSVHAQDTTLRIPTSPAIPYHRNIHSCNMYLVKSLNNLLDGVLNNRKLSSYLHIGEVMIAVELLLCVAKNSHDHTRHTCDQTCDQTQNLQMAASVWERQSLVLAALPVHTESQRHSLLHGWLASRRMN